MYWLKSYTSFVVGALLLGGVATFFYFRSPIAKIANNTLPTSIVGQKTIPDAKSSEVNKMYAIRKNVLDSGDVFYEIDATLLTDISIKEKAVSASITIDGDSEKTPIPVYFGVESSIISFSKKTGEKYNWEGIKVSSLAEAVKKGSRVKMRIQIPKNDDAAIKVSSQLDDLLHRNTLKEYQYVLMPQMIAVL